MFEPNMANKNNFQVQLSNFTERNQETYKRIQFKELYSDLLLVCDRPTGTEFAKDESSAVHAHQVVMAPRSGFIQRAIEEVKKAGAANQGKVVLFLGGITKNVLKHVMDFIYLGSVVVPMDEMKAFKSAVKSLEIEGLYDQNFDTDTEDNETEIQEHKIPVDHKSLHSLEKQESKPSKVSKIEFSPNNSANSEENKEVDEARNLIKEMRNNFSNNQFDEDAEMKNMSIKTEQPESSNNNENVMSYVSEDPKHQFVQEEFERKFSETKTKITDDEAMNYIMAVHESSNFKSKNESRKVNLNLMNNQKNTHEIKPLSEKRPHAMMDQLYDKFDIKLMNEQKPLGQSTPKKSENAKDNLSNSNSSMNYSRIASNTSGMPNNSMNYSRISDNTMTYSGMSSNTINTSRIAHSTLNYTGTSNNNMNYSRMSNNTMNSSRIAHNTTGMSNNTMNYSRISNGSSNNLRVSNSSKLSHELKIDLRQILAVYNSLTEELFQPTQNANCKLCPEMHIRGRSEVKRHLIKHMKEHESYAPILAKIKLIAAQFTAEDGRCTLCPQGQTVFQVQNTNHFHFKHLSKKNAEIEFINK